MSDGSLQLTDNCSVKMDDIILRVKEQVRSLSQGSQRAHCYPEVCLIFAQCYGHMFDKTAAADGGYISNIYWFTSEQLPTTNNLLNHEGEPEHVQLMNYARYPCRQQNLNSWKEAEDNEKIRLEQEELRRENEVLKQMLATSEKRVKVLEAVGNQAALLPTETLADPVAGEALEIDQQAGDRDDKRSLTSRDELIAPDDQGISLKSNSLKSNALSDVVWQLRKCGSRESDKKERRKSRPKSVSSKGSNFSSNITLAEGISLKSNSLTSKVQEDAYRKLLECGLKESGKRHKKGFLCCWKSGADEER